MATDPKIKSEFERQYPDTLQLGRDNLAKTDILLTKIDGLEEKFSNQLDQLSVKFSQDDMDALIIRLYERYGLKTLPENEVTFAFFDFSKIMALLIFEMIAEEDIRL